jgi:hypothetical protein
MMAFDFPSSPTTNQVYTPSSGPTYVWNGTAWVVLTPGNQFNRTVFTATAGQTTFTMNYLVGTIDVYRNGVKLAPADFTATNGTSIVFVNGCTAGDTIEVISYPQITYTDAVKRTGDTMTGNLTVPMVVTSSSLMFRNRIINGDMTINQRGGTITLAGSGLYGVDRWFGTEATDGTMTMQQSTVAPAGFTNSLLLTTGTADATLAATQFALVGQAIEGLNFGDLGWGTASAQPVTISFWVRSSLTGTFGGAVKNSASDRSYAFSYPINSANTWEYKTLTIAGDTSGTWFNNNGVGLYLLFGLGAGSTYSGTPGTWAAANYVAAAGSVSVIGTAGATFYLTGVQLEVGTVATSFERRPYGLEFTLCQRYFEVGYQPFFYMNLSGVTYGYGDVRFAVTKRAAPTITTSNFQYYSGGTAASFSLVLNSVRTDKFEYMAQAVTNFSGWTGVGTWTASSEL